MDTNFLICVLFISSVCHAKPPVVIQPKNPNDPRTLPPNVVRKALVIGGGLAGLSAALELADRGYNVTIKEASDVVGGKLSTRPFEVLGQKFYIEHGFHAWFHNYFQFKDIRDRLNINKYFRRWPAVHFAYRNYKPEILYSEGPYPLNLIGIITRSPNLKLTDAILSILAIPDLAFYNYDKMFAEYDNTSFEQWAKEKHVVQDFYDIIMQPSLSVTLNERDIFSAGEMLMFQQIYFLSNSESDIREVTTVNYYESILKPWTDYLESKGVKILLNNPVQSLKIDPKSMKTYGTVDQSGDDSTVYDHVIFGADLGAVQSIFTNTYNNYANEPGLSQSLIYCRDNHINKMKIAPDYKVIRLWFDKQMNSSAPDILETPDFTPINLIAQYHLLEEEFAVWANKTGGSVMEFHLYTFSKFFPKNTTDDQIWGLISPTVKLIYPEIFERNFQILAYHVNSYQNFASFEKGLYLSRPSVLTLAEKCSLTNTYIAGDWIKTSYPVALMERAVTTGREAANAILLSDHVRQASMTVISSDGPGL